MISVAIIGGSGYTGKYIVKFCNNHPFINDFEIYANKSADKSIHEVFPELVCEVEDKVIRSTKNLEYHHDVYFLALPHGESLNFVPKLIENDKIVIDLGADYRLDDYQNFMQTYNLNHSHPNLLKEKNYGLAEFNDKYSYNLIANPGCYPTAALLSIIPIVKNYSNSIQNISTIAYSGLSGAGKKVAQDMLFAENYNSVKAYNIGTHRHEAEISQEINKFGIEIDYSLTTHLLPIFSGIYSTTIIHLSDEVFENEIKASFNQHFEDSAFIRLRENPPELKWAIGTNYCDINVKCLGKKIIVTAAIDNLIKGAAGQAIQNMNKLFGWKEYLGINSYKEELENV